jgi:hypothetical protein
MKMKVLRIKALVLTLMPVLNLFEELPRWRLELEASVVYSPLVTAFSYSAFGFDFGRDKTDFATKIDFNFVMFELDLFELIFIISPG